MNQQLGWISSSPNSQTTLTTTKQYNSRDIIQEVKYLNELLLDSQSLLSKDDKQVLKEYRTRIISNLKHC